VYLRLIFLCKKLKIWPTFTRSSEQSTWPKYSTIWSPISGRTRWILWHMKPKLVWKIPFMGVLERSPCCRDRCNNYRTNGRLLMCISFSTALQRSLFLIHIVQPRRCQPAYSRVHMIHAVARKQQQQNLMQFPNSREERQLNKDPLLEFPLKIMPMHYILQPGLPEMAVAVVEWTFCFSFFIFLCMSLCVAVTLC